jgi:hypothetical protein
MSGENEGLAAAHRYATSILLPDQKPCGMIEKN